MPAFLSRSMVAEKFHALATRGINSRLKDYYDLGLIAATFELDRVLPGTIVLIDKKWRIILHIES